MQFSGKVLIAYYEAALQDYNNARPSSSSRYPFNINTIVDINEHCDESGYPPLGTPIREDRDLLLRSITSDAPLVEGECIKLCEALHRVSQHYRGADPNFRNTVLERIFLRACLSNNSSFIQDTYVYLCGLDINESLNWKKLLAVTCRDDLQIGFDWNTLDERWLIFSASEGMSAALLALADRTKDILEKKRHLFFLREQLDDEIPEELRKKMQAAIIGLGDIYVLEQKWRLAYNCYCSMKDSGFTGSILHWQEVSDQLFTVPATEISELTTPVMQLKNACDKIFATEFSFNSAEHNAVRLLLEECIITGQRFISLNPLDIPLILVGDQSLTAASINAAVVISNKGHFYEKCSAHQWLLGNGADPIVRGSFVLKSTIEPLNLNLVNAILNLQRLQLPQYAEFVEKLSPEWFSDVGHLNFLAHLPVESYTLTKVEHLNKRLAKGVAVNLKAESPTTSRIINHTPRIFPHKKSVIEHNKSENNPNSCPVL